MIDLKNDIIESFLNPKVERPSLWKSLTRKKEDVKADLMQKQSRYLLLTDYLKSRHWSDVARPKIIESLTSGLGKLLRDGPTMTEVELKSTIIEMRAAIEVVADMRFDIDAGQEASEKLKRYEDKQ